MTAGYPDSSLQPPDDGTPACLAICCSHPVPKHNLLGFRELCCRLSSARDLLSG